MAKFHPSGSQNPWTDFDETWHGWLRPWPHPHVNFDGVAQRGWSGQICDLSHLWVSFLSFFLAFFSARPGRTFPVTACAIMSGHLASRDTCERVSSSSIDLVIRHRRHPWHSSRVRRNSVSSAWLCRYNETRGSRVGGQITFLHRDHQESTIQLRRSLIPISTLRTATLTPDANLSDSLNGCWRPVCSVFGPRRFETP